MMLRRDQPYARVVVPDHKQIRIGTLRRIIADAGLTVEQFVELLRRSIGGDVGTEKDRCPMIDELDLVVLKRDLPAERLAAGDVGTVVLVRRQGKGYEVEFTTLSGDTVAVVTLDASHVRPVAAREMVHARAVN